jgi:hypothetical protein
MTKFNFLISKEQYVIQHLDSGDYFFDECKDIEQAVNEDWQEDFFIDEQDQEDSGKTEIFSYEEQREQHKETFSEYTKDEVLKAAREGYGWPINCGILEEIEEEDEEEDEE